MTLTIPNIGSQNYRNNLPKRKRILTDCFNNRSDRLSQISESHEATGNGFRVSWSLWNFQAAQQRFCQAAFHHLMRCTRLNNKSSVFEILLLHIAWWYIHIRYWFCCWRRRLPTAYVGWRSKFAKSFYFPRSTGIREVFVYWVHSINIFI